MTPTVKAMAITAGATKAATEPTTATPAPTFRRWRHAGFAVLALVHGPLSVAVWPLVPRILDTQGWSPELDVLTRTVPVCFVVFVAWLAFELFDTRSGVTVFPRRWTDVGVVVLVAFALRELIMAWLLATGPDVQIDEALRRWTGHYMGDDGQLFLGWVVVSALINAVGEELVYRALLLRALEGFMGSWSALVVQALVFELVHVFVYGLGFHGGVWFVVALIYGVAFQRTRSLAVPVVLHATTSVVFDLTVWALATRG